MSKAPTLDLKSIPGQITPIMLNSPRSAAVRRNPDPLEESNKKVEIQIKTPPGSNEGFTQAFAKGKKFRKKKS